MTDGAAETVDAPKPAEAETVKADAAEGAAAPTEGKKKNQNRNKRGSKKNSDGKPAADKPAGDSEAPVADSSKDSGKADGEDSKPAPKNNNNKRRRNSKGAKKEKKEVDNKDGDSKDADDKENPPAEGEKDAAADAKPKRNNKRKNSGKGKGNKDGEKKEETTNGGATNGGATNGGAVEVQMTTDTEKKQEKPSNKKAPINKTVNLDSLARATPHTILRPLEFFVAWSGVITLAFHGLHPKLKEFKQKVADLYPGLAQQNPGSRWPKTTLGALKDGKRLSPKQLRALKDICVQLEVDVASCCPDGVLVKEISTVVYECLSLERIISENKIQCNGRSKLTNEEPEESEQKAVKKVLSEFSKKNIDKYWNDVAKDGNRASHYRDATVGSTCVTFIGRSLSEGLKKVLDNFRSKVDKALPGMYVWFDDTSLHVTHRALA
eukprot:CAMPEP_0197844380 /NCGR_PEP_ID=MMETSP1438-20131217/1364_1 /TAXON_ID=1461541 /ORGANISM="Pterosperma sp., Strain CCMP1384" /LENGTH=435 /DNA_ID=CAMNT_0043455137 /DNA_START=110 /DNA_END=1417 /DNA_ORIENTATION=+